MRRSVRRVAREGNEGLAEGNPGPVRRSQSGAVSDGVERVNAEDGNDELMRGNGRVAGGESLGTRGEHGMGLLRRGGDGEGGLQKQESGTNREETLLGRSASNQKRGLRNGTIRGRTEI